MKKKIKNTPTSIPYGKQSINKSDQKAILAVLQSPYLTQGPKVQEFEKEIAKYCGARYVVAFANGTAALHAACHAAGIKSGDEGITSPISFTASANCLLFVGATPKFADIEKKTAQIHLDKIAPIITRKTKAIIPVDLAGRPTNNLSELYSFCQKKNIKLIVDAAHSFGADYKVGKKSFKVGCSSHSDMTCLSFHPVKTMTTGEGGAVTTNSKDLYQKLLLFRHHGITKNPKDFENNEFKNHSWYYEMHDLGYNYRITDMQCALGLSQLKRIDTFVEKRRKIAKRYQEKLCGHIDFLASDDKWTHSAHHIFPVLFPKEKKEALFEHLRKQRIFGQLHYFPIYRQPYYQKKFRYTPKDYPQTEEYFRRAISLPIFPDLKWQEQKYVIDTINSFLEK